MKRLTILDIIITSIFFILMFFLLINIFFHNISSDRELLVITPDGRYYYSLDQKKILEMRGSHGVTLIEIENGKFHFIDSPCLHKECIKMGLVSLENYPVICLPNRVSAYIVSKKKQLEFDDVSR